MSSKILLAAGVAAAFLVGAMANGLYTATTRAFNPAQENALLLGGSGRSETTMDRSNLAPARTVYVSNPAPAPVRVATASTAPARVAANEKKRSFGKEALIIGGSAGAGAAVGAVAGGKKGAAIGVISGGVAGLIYDLATRNK